MQTASKAFFATYPVYAAAVRRDVDQLRQFTNKADIDKQIDQVQVSFIEITGCYFHDIYFMVWCLQMQIH